MKEVDVPVEFVELALEVLVDAKLRYTAKLVALDKVEVDNNHQVPVELVVAWIVALQRATELDLMFLTSEQAQRGGPADPALFDRFRELVAHMRLGEEGV